MVRIGNRRTTDLYHAEKINKPQRRLPNRGDDVEVSVLNESKTTDDVEEIKRKRRSQHAAEDTHTALTTRRE
jgi:hypothetical protein